MNVRRQTLAVAALISAGCTAAESGPKAPEGAVAEFVAWVSGGVERTADRFEVWICHVPSDTAVDVYEPSSARLDVEPAALTATIAPSLTRYFETISLGRYRPTFVAGGHVELGVEDDSQDCTAFAAAQSNASTTAILAVADAEHTADAPGGWGRPNNDTCPQPTCSARESGRAIYVGAADFHPDWRSRPPLDLVEHEIGHSLGWPHSATGDTATASGMDPEHASPIDLMSDSAAPRRADSARRDGPDVLGVERLLSGWIDPSTILDGSARSGRITLTPPNASPSTPGPRLVIIATGPHRVATIESVHADGLNGHLTTPGVAIHVIDLARAPVLPVVQGHSTDGLLHAGDHWAEGGVDVEVVSATEVSISRR